MQRYRLYELLYGVNARKKGEKEREREIVSSFIVC